MEYPMRRTNPFHHRQRGIALFVVIVFVLLSMLLALWASRTALFNELVVGNDADYQRAFEAAQALLQDAELDIRGEGANGAACIPIGGLGDVCRDTTIDKIPQEPAGVSDLLSTLANEPTLCRNGLCAKRAGRQDFWNYTSTTSPAPTGLQPGEVRIDQMATAGIGARYGQFTGATINPNSNPILADQTADNRGGWYWIEVLPYDESSKNAGVITGGNTNLLPLHLTPNVVYRITAVAYGRKTNLAGDPVTMVVLQQAYAPTRRKD